MNELHYTLSPESDYRFVDPEIPALQAVLDPRALRQHLIPVIPPQWGTLRDVEIEVLTHHRRKRCTVNIALETTAGKHELIGKIFATDRVDVYQAMTQISHAGFGPEEEFSIPEPLGYIPELHLLLQEKVYGPPVAEVFLTGSGDERLRAAQKCARWLAHFHAHAPLLGSNLVLRSELMDKWPSRFVNGLSSLDAKARLLAERLEIAATWLGPIETCACHGGFSHQQVILADDRVVTVDWDSYCVGDPARDVAKFILKLQLARKLNRSGEALDAAIEGFYKTYTTTSKFEVTRQLPFYKAFHCLQYAKSENKGFKKIRRLLDEGLRILAEEM